MTTPSKAEMYEQLKRTLHELFETPLENIHGEALLYEELDLDSIDAVDLIVHLQTLTDRKFNPEEFKSVKTVNDVVNVIYAELERP
ncbi:MAG: acyl carrier protein [Gammaproteobacteria bacterium CG11_big_fil_rev_8_21_14_0_20_46_22]|nr:MAG: acyl carrier protein [Gammaproteobacteria bacterium CG12_big_fil_rev_8_21_14_0_65_46_12]PIR10077.1 MAG: acyl carrier protein [Gammaproteobacteria bacterium CG11_big_fil_rev_8_21_14_0_20_46_22]